MPESLSARPASASWRRFTAAAPAGRRLPTDAAVYGPDVATEVGLRLLGSIEGKRVIDLGCGAGHGSISLARAGARVIGVDPSAEQLALAKEAAAKAGVRVELHHADPAALAFLQAETIDAAFSAFALAEVVDLERVFRQVNRVLKQAAPFAFSLPHPAFAMLDPTGKDPLRVARRYGDKRTVTWSRNGEEVTDHHRSIGEVFAGLTRANFRVDALLEPEPEGSSARSAHWTEIMRYVPATVIFRGRKAGG